MSSTVVLLIFWFKFILFAQGECTEAQLCWNNNRSECLEGSQHTCFSQTWGKYTSPKGPHNEPPQFRNWLAFFAIDICSWDQNSSFDFGMNQLLFCLPKATDGIVSCLSLKRCHLLWEIWKNSPDALIQSNFGRKLILLMPIASQASNLHYYM